MSSLANLFGAIRRMLTGERKPEQVCPECGSPVGFLSASKDSEVLYDVWQCNNGHRGDRGTEVEP